MSNRAPQYAKGEQAHTQQDLIVLHLRRKYPEWVPGYDLNRVEVPPLGYLSHNASRRARELAEAGSIERKLEGGEVYYRAQAGPPVVAAADGTVLEQPRLPL